MKGRRGHRAGGDRPRVRAVTEHEACRLDASCQHSFARTYADRSPSPDVAIMTTTDASGIASWKHAGRPSRCLKRGSCWATEARKVFELSGIADTVRERDTTDDAADLLHICDFKCGRHEVGPLLAWVIHSVAHHLRGQPTTVPPQSMWIVARSRRALRLRRRTRTYRRTASTRPTSTASRPRLTRPRRRPGRRAYPGPPRAHRLAGRPVRRRGRRRTVGAVALRRGDGHKASHLDSGVVER